MIGLSRTYIKPVGVGEREGGEGRCGAFSFQAGIFYRNLQRVQVGQIPLCLAPVYTRSKVVNNLTANAPG